MSIKAEQKPIFSSKLITDISTIKILLTGISIEKILLKYSNYSYLVSFSYLNILVFH